MKHMIRHRTHLGTDALIEREIEEPFFTLVKESVAGGQLKLPGDLKRYSLEVHDPHSFSVSFDGVLLTRNTCSKRGSKITLTTEPSTGFLSFAHDSRALQFLSVNTAILEQHVAIALMGGV